MTVAGMPAEPASGTPPLRTWQRRALSAYLLRRPADFLAVATPGAGKTTFALRVAGELLADRTVAAVTVVTPTEHLKNQWAAAAGRLGIPLDPTFRNADGATARDFRGAVLTYAQVAAAPALHRARTAARRTLVVLDEVHHAGDALSWGDAVREAFEPAARRLALTGTPFRSDENPIPFVRYEPEPDGALRSARRPRLRLRRGAAGRRGPAGDLPGVLRGGPVADPRRDGAVRAAGRARHRRARGPGLADRARPGRRLGAGGAAGRRPAAVPGPGRRMPDAGGLVIATDQAAARAYAAMLREITGTPPAVVLSDDRGRDRADRPVRRVGRPLDGRGADGERGRGRAPARGRGVRDAARRRRCSSPRRSGGSSGRGGRGRPPRCSCPRCRRCCGWPASWRRSATTCSGGAGPTGRGRRLGRRPARRGPGRAGRADRARTGVHRAGRVRAAGPGDLRRRVVRHRGDAGYARGGGLPRVAGTARSGAGSGAAAGAAGQAGRAAEEGAAGGDRAGRGAADGDARAPGRAAQAAQRAGRRVPPSHRPAARGDPQPSCAATAADRRPPSAPSNSSSSASPPSSPGDPGHPAPRRVTAPRAE